MSHLKKISLFYKQLLLSNIIWIRKIIYWALIWFAIGLIIPLLFPDAARFLIETMVNFFKQVLHGNDATISLSTVWFIFSQNARAMIIALFLGIVLGIIPRLSTALNFSIIGVLFAATLKKSLLGALLFILVLIPHGIFEIPTMIISAAFGLRLGLFWKITEPNLTNKQKFFLALKQNAQLIPLIILLLVCAAFAEVFVSGEISRLVSMCTRIF